MRRSKSRFPLRAPIFLTAALAVLSLVSLGALVYWGRESLSWVNLWQTRGTLIHLTQKVEELDERMSGALQELEALKQEHGAMRSQVEALEADTTEASVPREDLKALKQEQKALWASIVALDNRLDDLPAIREELVTIREELQTSDDSQIAPTPSQGEPLPDPKSLGVPLYRQSHSLSCEAASASMVAAFFGLSLSEQEVIEALPRHENPNLGYRGNIDGATGSLEDYGVHAAPLQKTLTTLGLRVRALEGGLEGIHSALNAGHPLIAWITYNLWEQSPVELGLSDGTTVKVVPYEHAVVIEGYTTDGLWALDPYDGEREFLPWADFERSWGYLDYMALQVEGKAH